MGKHLKQKIMDNRKLIISISGETGVGKSRVGYLLKKFLKEEGFNVKYVGNHDHPTEDNFDSVMSKNLDEALSSIKPREIAIQEVQLQRSTIK